MPRPKPPIANAYKAEPWHWWVEDGQTNCGICGDEMEVGQQVIEVPFDGESRMDVTAHLGCAINGNEVLL